MELDFRCIQTEMHWQISDFNLFQTTCFSDNKNDLTWLENRFLLPALVWQNLAILSSILYLIHIFENQIIIVTLYEKKIKEKCLND